MSANGVAIAALICGLAFIVPLAPVVAVVLGVIALRQLRRRARAGRPQRGRGMAITGIVLGSLGLLIWALVVVAAVRFADENDRRVPSQSGARATSGRVTVDQLRPGDCFSGISPASLDWASLNRCDDAHEMQLITTVDLADDPYPGDEDAAGDLVEQRCVAASEPLLDESKLDRVDLFFIYQNTRLGWRQNSSALCIAASADGVLLGSVLQ
ncbi:DUF4190 domain-containing protein [Intrasporangium sp.]|uniref:DUF4190 domain-containing protein n=1 Tax=Intrasporangium sp. TaxID=1925024 RepID=UPI003365814E